MVARAGRAGSARAATESDHPERMLDGTRTLRHTELSAGRAQGRMSGDGAGHVLITSRSKDWRDIAVEVKVNVLSPDESVTLLQKSIEGLSAEDAATVAGAVGDLPLAISQAGDFPNSSGMPAAQYAAALKTRAAQLLAEGESPGHDEKLSAVVLLAHDRLKRQSPLAADLAVICTFLAPEPMPVDWFRAGAKHLPRRLRRQVADPVALRGLIGALTSSAGRCVTWVITNRPVTSTWSASTEPACASATATAPRSVPLTTSSSTWSRSAGIRKRAS
jgi:hypothetical protein